MMWRVALRSTAGGARGLWTTTAAEAAASASAASAAVSEGGGVTGRSAAGQRHALRFYTNVDVVESKGKDATGKGQWRVALDGKMLNTPKRHPLIFPSRALAMAVAAEWEQQGTAIKPFTMPLMTLAATSADQVSGIESQVAEAMADYLDTDQMCFREPLVASKVAEKTDVPGSLMGRVASTQADRAQRLRDQQEQWCRPIVEWAESKFGHTVTLHEGVMSYGQDAQLHAAVRAYLEGLGAAQLTGVEAIVSTSKSMLLGLALAEGVVSVDHAVSACRVEEDFQMHEWGLVEGGHDLDTSSVAAALHAPALWIRLHRAAAAQK